MLSEHFQSFIFRAPQLPAAVPACHWHCQWQWQWRPLPLGSGPVYFFFAHTQIESWISSLTTRGYLHHAAVQGQTPADDICVLRVDTFFSSWMHFRSTETLP